MPDASEKEVTSRNQAHALKKRTGCMTCASSLNVYWKSSILLHYGTEIRPTPQTGFVLESWNRRL